MRERLVCGRREDERTEYLSSRNPGVRKGRCCSSSVV